VLCPNAIDAMSLLIIWGALKGFLAVNLLEII
jgi:hypothetical protein